ncbi:hypothetical protein BOW53_04785 [Solemya pervernicosa gill symbiont]|uniref:Phosphatidate cytidylyltransferase n=2 Tax=Gammaproteobacteria incertae sedis TaxID=118884 RepID=A0A1T2L7U5_9GAMM|nr:phosphatidate cytidylyltransferase [Candidatus Reidiella endopervernicosa]OOZ41185.1 hypothetical protein BOW53_04785 [Solemya pervernicosa gill symbiont]QKQ27090.1 phosphatidate cytidylyltransferase [Candidatus Reidiella endopervernicosa]
MLKQRLITAAVLILIAFAAIFGLSSSQLSILFAAIALAGAWEWGRLIGLERPLAKLAYLILLILLLYAGWTLSEIPVLVTNLLIATAVVWVVIIAAIVRYRGESGVTVVTRLFHAVAGLWLLSSTWLALLLIHRGQFSPVVDETLPSGALSLLYMLTLIWVADSGAYFSGRRFGKNRLARYVSPGKTLEGAFGALLAVSIWALLGAYLFGLNIEQGLLLVVVSLITALFSIAGDLYESLLKRRIGLKDSGQLLPGHGGVLDRIDSLLAAAPIFLLGLSLLGGKW